MFFVYLYTAVTFSTVLNNKPNRAGRHEKATRIKNELGTLFPKRPALECHVALLL